MDQLNEILAQVSMMLLDGKTLEDAKKELDIPDEVWNVVKEAFE